jgi:hypothetical protein
MCCVVEDMHSIAEDMCCVTEDMRCVAEDMRSIAEDMCHVAKGMRCVAVSDMIGVWCMGFFLYKDATTKKRELTHF